MTRIKLEFEFFCMNCIQIMKLKIKNNKLLKNDLDCLNFFY